MSRTKEVVVNERRELAARTWKAATAYSGLLSHVTTTGADATLVLDKPLPSHGRL